MLPCNWQVISCWLMRSSFPTFICQNWKSSKRILCHIFLLDISAILTKQAWSQILEKAGFNPTYKLIWTSLDRPKIMQIHCFMEDIKDSYLDLQFILSKMAKEAKDIKKTILFANNILDIRLIIAIITK